MCVCVCVCFAAAKAAAAADVAAVAMPAAKPLMLAANTAPAAAVALGPVRAVPGVPIEKVCLCRCCCCSWAGECCSR